MAGRIKDADKLIEIIDDDIASLDKNMSREGYDVCLCTLKMVKQYIKALPTIDAEPIKHGRWLPSKDGHGCECSECGTAYRWNEIDTMRYCKMCGARMDGGENE